MRTHTSRVDEGRSEDQVERRWCGWGRDRAEVPWVTRAHHVVPTWTSQQHGHMDMDMEHVDMDMNMDMGARRSSEAGGGESYIHALGYIELALTAV